MKAANSRTDLILKAAAAILTIALCVVVAGTLEPKVVEKGDTAPKFTVATDQGRTISRSDFGGKVLVLNFWATWCGPCLQELPSLDQFTRKFQNQGVTVLAVSVDRNEKRYKELLDRVKPAFLSSRDPDAGIPVSYGTFMYPETYIIGKDGKVLYKEANARDWMDPAFLNYFQSLL
ncbi:MAG: TlpA family protein disulfide reductase [Acidobacteria bacterium]|nr:TlpA family protein disulfide reductase [Acidobacteriota bacterium]